MQTNLGRVQGAGFFYCTEQSSASVQLASLTPNNIHPLVGDNVVFNNGDVRKITTVAQPIVACSEVVANLTGPQGEHGIDGVNGISITSATVEEVV